jgi:hypothetical protein
MPQLEPKLLYAMAQQMNPRRAGTPGRALRNWEAVVDYWRPLLLCMALCLFAMPLHAQSGARHGASIQLRIGALYATPLIKDEGASATVHDSIPGISKGITVQQKIAPIATLAVRLPMRSRTSLEISASAARSPIQGDDGKTTWTVATATIGNALFGFGYAFRPYLTLHGGVGVTKLFAPQTGLFTSGNSFKPLFELGAATPLNFGGRAFQIDARAQSHSFGTTTLRDNGASDGNVLRAVLQIGTTLWQGGR